MLGIDGIGQQILQRMHQIPVSARKSHTAAVPRIRLQPVAFKIAVDTLRQSPFGIPGRFRHAFSVYKCRTPLQIDVFGNEYVLFFGNFFTIGRIISESQCVQIGIYSVDRAAFFVRRDHQIVARRLYNVTLIAERRIIDTVVLLPLRLSDKDLIFRLRLIIRHDLGDALPRFAEIFLQNLRRIPLRGARFRRDYDLIVFKSDPVAFQFFRDIRLFRLPARLIILPVLRRITGRHRKNCAETQHRAHQ